MANIIVKIELKTGKAFTTSLSDTTQIGKYFTLRELANQSCKEQVKYIISPGSQLQIVMADEFRKWYNKAMPCECSYRSQSWNKQVGGVSNSLHLSAQAMDLHIGAVTDSQWKNLANKWESICKKHGTVGEIGRYQWGIHIGSGVTYSKVFYMFDKR